MISYTFLPTSLRLSKLNPCRVVSLFCTLNVCIHVSSDESQVRVELN
jgi:hypothetical protein